jgi:DNA repair photolyase
MKNKKYATGTWEWAHSGVNCISGCRNSCLYCYSKASAIKAGRKTKDTWPEEEVDEKAINKGYKKREGTIMFPTSHDLSPENMDFWIKVLFKMLKAGNDVLIVSKPHIECISEICRTFSDYKDKILFRFTIGSASDRILKFFEPGAPPFNERLASLILAYKLGFKTSVSSEPMLDGNIDAVIEATEHYITDAIWLGKANNMIERMTTNGAIGIEVYWGGKLVEHQNDDNIKALYEKYKDNPKVKWKDSIKQVVGLKRHEERGIDE